jgi:hypothetical protein
MNNNFTTTFTNFLKSLNVKVTKATAEKYVETHPDYPSMLAYADALDAWKIENAAVRVSTEQLSELPTPFITYSRRKGGMFSVVRSVTNGIIERLDTETGWVKDKLEDFLPDWSGVVMLAELNDLSGENDYETKRHAERLQALRLPLAFTILGVIVLITFIFNAATLGIYSVLLGITKTALAIITTLLLIKSIDTNNAFVNKLCNAGTKLSCQSILESNAAKITAWLSWSDVGFIYAVGSLVSLLFALSSPFYLDGFIFITLITSGLGALFSFYSVYYQGVIAKIWCPLCLGVVALFWAELALAGSYIYANGFVITNATLVLLLSSIAFLIPVAFLLIYKTTAASAQKADSVERELERLKSNPKIFATLLASEREMPFLPQGMGVVELGNLEAENTLTVVTNPLCGWCGKMHRRVNKVLAESPNLKCQIVFLTNSGDIDDTARIARTIFSVPKELRHEAINAWFTRNDRNFDSWQAVYSGYEVKDVAKVFEENQRMWSNEAEVKSTPTLFFNGRKLPASVQVEDLVQFTRFSTQKAESLN